MINPTEETQAPSAAVPDATASTPSGAPSNETSGSEQPVDFNRLLDDDDYAAQVEQDQAAASPAPSEPAQTTEAQQASGSTPAPAGTATPQAAANDPDPIVATITVEGVQMPVRRSEQQGLLQKGRYMERRFEQAAHLLRLEKDAPDVAALLRDPVTRAKTLELIRTGGKPPAAPAASEDEDGLDAESRELIDKRVDARARALLAQAGIQVPEPEDPAAESARVAGLQTVIDTLKEVDDDFPATSAAMEGFYKQIRDEKGPEVAQALIRAIRNPNNRHPVTGKRLIVQYRDDARAWARANAAAPAAGAPAPTAPAAPAARPQARTITATLEPGSPAPRSAPGRASGQPDFRNMSAVDKAKWFNDFVDGD